MSAMPSARRREYTVDAARLYDAPRERVFAAPERLVIHCFADDARGVQRLEETITVHLADAGGRTRLTLRATAAGAGPEAAAMLRDKNPAKANAALQAMLQMGRLDIAGLQRAFDQA